MNKPALSSRPNTFEKKLVGIVVATVGEKRAKFELVEDNNKTFSDGSKSIKVNLADLPAVPKLTEKDNGKQFRIRMNSEGDEIEAITPVTGHYTAKLIDLGPRKNGKDSDPEPDEKDDSRFDNGKSHLEFFAVYKIVEGRYKGVQMPAYNLHYKFEDDGNGMTRFAGNTENPKATRLHQLVNFGMLHKMFDEEIEYPEDGNILPTLLERALDADVTVDITVKNGYITDVLPVQDEDDEVEEAPKKRFVSEINKELGYEDEEGKPTARASKEDLDVDRDFPKDEPKKAKKAAKKVTADDDSDL